MSQSRFTTRRTILSAACATVLASTLSACGGGGGGTSGGSGGGTPPETPQTISLGSSASRIVGSTPVVITATLGRSADVSWALASGNPGTLSASSGASVTYTPPAGGVAAITPITITATSAGVSASVKLALTPDPRQRTGLALLAGGLGGRGLINGTGSAVRFNQIAAIDTDSNGALLIADRNDPYGDGQNSPTPIRQLSVGGDVTTITNPFIQFGHADGDVTTAQIGTVGSLAAAPSGELYLIDTDGQARLRVLSSSGAIRTVQNSVLGNRVLVDRAGQVYVYSSARIVRVGADGSNTVLAGDSSNAVQADGLGTAARFWNITDAAADASGNLYVTDDNTVRKITPAGLVTTVAGLASGERTATDGSASAARFISLLSLAFDASGNLQLLEQVPAAGGGAGYNVRQLTPGGAVSTLYRGEAPPFTGIATAPDTATAVTRLRYNRVAGRTLLAHTAQVDQLAGGVLSVLAGDEGDNYRELDGAAATARFVRPSRLAADLAGNVYTLDFAAPYGAARDEDAHGLWLRKIALDGSVSTLVADPGFAFKPNGIVADADGNLFVSAVPPQRSLSLLGGGALYKVTPDGKVSLFAGAASAVASGVSTDGTGSAASFAAPQLEGITLNGDLYLSDSGKIRRVTPQAVVSTVGALPAGLKAAPDGKVYSADRTQHVIWATDASAVKSAVVGVPGVAGTRLTSLPAGLESPADIVPTGPHSFALISGAAVLRLLLPN